MPEKIYKFLRKMFYGIYRVLRVVVVLYLFVFIIMFVAGRYNGQKFPFDYLQGLDTDFAKNILADRLPMLDQSMVKNLYGYKFSWTDEVVNLRFHYLDDSILKKVLLDFERDSDMTSPNENKAWDKIPDSNPNEKYVRLRSSIQPMV